MLLGSVNYFIELRSDNNCVLGINMWYSEWSLGGGHRGGGDGGSDRDSVVLLSCEAPNDRHFKHWLMTGPFPLCSLIEKYTSSILTKMLPYYAS